MCQLLGMNGNTPTDIVFSFDGFRRRAGITDRHADGFGIAFFEGPGVRLFQDGAAASVSPVADLIHRYPIRSRNVVAHIRKATQGDVALANTHPFLRELWGEYWVFAHNGNLKNFAPARGRFFRPVGDTDSERAFCFLLETLRARFDDPPDDERLFAEIVGILRRLRDFGLLNVMISNGRWLLVHCASLLHYIIRCAPFGVAHLADDDVHIDFAEVTTPNDKVAIVATLPLTRDETWTRAAVNETLMFRDGEVVYRDLPQNPVYLTPEEGLRLAQEAA